MTWADKLIKETAYPRMIFEELLYVTDGTITHGLYLLVDRRMALELYPKQDVNLYWPRGSDDKHRFVCACNKVIPIINSIYTIDDIQDQEKLVFCNPCLKSLPRLMCDQAILDLLDYGNFAWITRRSVDRH